METAHVEIPTSNSCNVAVGYYFQWQQIQALDSQFHLVFSDVGTPLTIGYQPTKPLQPTVANESPASESYIQVLRAGSVCVYMYFYLLYIEVLRYIYSAECALNPNTKIDSYFKTNRYAHLLRLQFL